MLWVDTELGVRILSSGMFFGVLVGFVVVVLVMLVVRMVKRSHSRRIQHGVHMLSMLGEMESNGDRREFLREEKHFLRCDCREYALPLPDTIIIDDFVTHGKVLCQPTREAIRNP